MLSCLVDSPILTQNDLTQWMAEILCRERRFRLRHSAAPLHEAQLLTYLRLSGCRVGLLINCNTVSLTDGLRRRVL